MKSFQKQKAEALGAMLEFLVSSSVTRYTLSDSHRVLLAQQVRAAVPSNCAPRATASLPAHCGPSQDAVSGAVCFHQAVAG